MTVSFLGSLAPLAVDILLWVGVLGVLVADVLWPPGDKRALGVAAFAVLVLCFAATFVFGLDGVAAGGAYVGDGFALYTKRLFYCGGALAVLGTLRFGSEVFPRRQGEYYQLLMFSVAGMSLLAGARDALLLVVAFELMGIPLYLLAAWIRGDAGGAEAGLKLFLTGALSSATLIYGVSMLVGMAGTTSLDGIAIHVSTHPSVGAVVAGAFVLAGVGFKIGVFPFHMWVPDTYQGASTPFVAFLSAAPKAAGIVTLAQVLLAGDRALLDYAAGPLLGLAGATLLMGNFLALNQSNVKRLLAYSGVAHMGLMLMALTVGDSAGVTMLLFYLAAYTFTNIGAFLVVHVVQRSGGDDTLASFDGLGRRNLGLGLAMLAFLLSLAGIPFAVGFWAKLYVFVAAWKDGQQLLVLLAALLSVLGLFYYLRVVRAMFMNPPKTEAKVQSDFATTLAIGVCLAFVLFAGLFPTPLTTAAHDAAVAFFKP